MPTIVSTVSSTTTITVDSDSSDISIRDFNDSPSIPSLPYTSTITLDNDKKIDGDPKSSSSLSLYTIKDIKNDRDFLLHYIFKYFINGNFTSPIDSPTMKNCLDIGFGSGIWMMETATQFPNCRFHGIDIKPRTPDSIYPQNCSFIKGDFLEGLPYANETFDLVNVRLIVNTLTLNQLDFLLGEIYRVLKPKGYIEILEQDLSIFDNCGIETLKAMKILNKNNYSQPIKTMLHDLLNKQGKFSHSKDLKIHVPMGKWAGMVGKLYLEAFGLSLSNHPSFTPSSSLLNNNERKVIKSMGFEKLFKIVSLECDRYKTNFTYYIGSAKKN